MMVLGVVLIVRHSNRSKLSHFFQSFIRSQLIALKPLCDILSLVHGAMSERSRLPPMVTTRRSKSKAEIQV